MGYADEIRRLRPKTRNRLRSILTLDTKEAIKVLDAIRRQGGAGELAQVDRVLWASPSSDTPLIPALFPRTPQTKEQYRRLEPIPLDLQLGVIEKHVQFNLSKARALIDLIGCLNKALIAHQFERATDLLVQLVASFGFSHFALRKAALIRVSSPSQPRHSKVDAILDSAGLAENNVIASSLVHCYQEEPEFLSLKRSIMNLNDRGPGNKFTRDISRLPFHPHSIDEDDFRDQLQSALQSSLLDSLILAQFNSYSFPLKDYPYLDQVISSLGAAAPPIDDIACFQTNIDNESELVFYKRSSAWLECPDIARYRRLLDHFYDSPDADYIVITQSLLSNLDDWVGVRDLDSLSESQILTRHGSESLRELQNAGTATRSALFNYCLHLTQGYGTVSESNLVKLMGRTRDLHKTIPIEFASNLAKCVGSQVSKLILFLLIAKKSRNERDEHLLRRIVQDITIARFERSLVALLNHLESQSSDVARYAYEVFTEDFIAKLYHLVQSTSEITDTRADLHKWMGHLTGDKAYLDRARTLLIDHQLNKVRNEIDDNRIYVDVARFHEWINEELFRDFSTALSSIDHKGIDFSSVDTVVGVLIERCYSTFCSHKAFGIASYLGRRIRHGTFKGHLYSGVVGLEREVRFASLMADPHVYQWWREWKSKYEEKIDEIIRERLHVASTAKRDGLLRPSHATHQKNEIVMACTRAIVKEYSESKAFGVAVYLITEYCWRLAEVDLKAFNAYLKGQRRSLAESLPEIVGAAPSALRDAANDFSRAISRTIGERLMAMQTWFNRPATVSPKASLSLLYKAVVEEVRETFPALHAPLDVNPEHDVELFGGAYHVLYDSFYVVVYNAAKHGKPGSLVEPRFSIVKSLDSGRTSVQIEISSEIPDDQDEMILRQRLCIESGDNVDNAQTYENRSGIPKLYHLQNTDPAFCVKSIHCIDRRVGVVLDYRVEH